MYVCLSVSAPRLVIVSGVIWTPYDWLNKFYCFCIAAVIGIVSRHGLTIEAHCRNQHNKSRLALFKPLLHFYSQLYISKKMEYFSYKGGCGIGGHTSIET